ncbi:hydroxyisourate hydrolase [Nocardioides sp. REDSEA-S30_B4]|jgi:5-hydroxyisourate hydrolase|uniref:hydroxyisourate hydrolase n=1 Tax=Nocardioides sp. REDSEA-S30_B4 TaxID=1811552 RepID=UPI000B24CF23|nr:hydroxyisourate hydrolase [Nocardioides sp. REDSEA-S30_B4]
MSSLSTHVLDTARGEPAAGVTVTLHTLSGATEEQVTDADGRARFETGVEGPTTLRFDTAGVSEFFPEVVLTFVANAARAHHHVPLLLSPFAYSTYRGS